MAVRGVKTLILSRKTQSSVAGLGAKVALRRMALEHVGGSDQAAVLDVFSGDGEMYRAVWHHAGSYAGCDLEWRRDGRMVWICDNRRLLRCIDLAAWNVFDLDAYGAPWRQLYILAHRRRLQPGERVAIVITAGMAKNMISKVPRPGRGSGLDPALCRLTGLSRDTVGIFDDRELVMRRLADGLAQRMAGKLVSLKLAKKDAGSPVVYAVVGLEAISRSKDAHATVRYRSESP